MIPAAVANSWFFWLAIIGFVVGVYSLPTVIAIARQVEGLGWVICLNTIPVGWPAALLCACLMPRKEIGPVLTGSGHAGSRHRRGHIGKLAADSTATAEDNHVGVGCVASDELADTRRHVPTVSDEVPGDPVIDADRVVLPAAVP